MRRLLLSAALSVACTPAAPPCPKCYEIDKVAPFEPPTRIIILCDVPDAGTRLEDDDGGELPE